MEVCESTGLVFMASVFCFLFSRMSEQRMLDAICEMPIENARVVLLLIELMYLM